jgi:hypothetical protein
MSPIHHHRLVRNIAPHQTLLNTLTQTRRQRSRKLRKILPVDLRRKSQSSINDIRTGKPQEVLRDRACTGVLAVQTCDADGGLAVIVLLPVDAALWEDGSLPDGEVGLELVGQAIFEDEAGGHFGVGCEGEVFCGSGMHCGSRQCWYKCGCRKGLTMRCVQAARLEEDGGRGDAQASQDGEVGTVGEVYLTAHTGGDVRVGGWVVIELEGDCTGINLSLDVLEAGHCGVLGQELADKAFGWDLVGSAGLSELTGRGRR